MDTALENRLRTQLDKPTGELHQADFKSIRFMLINDEIYHCLPFICKHCVNIESVNVVGGDKDITTLSELKHLKRIGLNDPSEKQCENLKYLKNLEALTLFYTSKTASHCNFSLESAHKIKHLQIFDFVGRPVSISDITSFTSLVSLRIVAMELTNVAFFEQLSALEEVDVEVYHCDKEKLQTALHRLENLKNVKLIVNSERNHKENASVDWNVKGE